MLCSWGVKAGIAHSLVDKQVQLLYFYFLPRDAMVAWYMPWPCFCSSVTSRSYIKKIKRVITHIMPHDSPGILSFLVLKIVMNSNAVTMNGDAKIHIFLYDTKICNFQQIS